MKTWLSASAVVIAGAMLWSGTALGQTSTKPGCDAMKAGAPQKVEGQVVNVDPNQGKVTVKTSDGKTQEFQASQDTIRDFKVGDKIEARLRVAANC
jgi:Cu/Ag efflux protein CusF